MSVWRWGAGPGGGGDKPSPLPGISKYKHCSQDQLQMLRGPGRSEQRPNIPAPTPQMDAKQEVSQ